MGKPKYEHDCEECTYLGEISHEGTVFDLYSHVRKQFEFTEFIARYGDDGPEYLSGIDGSVDNHPILNQALKRHCLLVE